MNLPKTEIFYEPKGGMCMNCTKFGQNCSELPFDKMPVVERYFIGSNENVRVKCTEQAPRNQRKNAGQTSNTS